MSKSKLKIFYPTKHNLLVYLVWKFNSTCKTFCTLFGTPCMFLNWMNFSSHFVFTTRVKQGDFWPHLGTVKWKISRFSGGFNPCTLTRTPPIGPSERLTTPRPPAAQGNQIFGNSLSCLWHDKTQLKSLVELLEDHRTVSVLICGFKIMFGQFIKPGHFLKSTLWKIVAPWRVFTYLPEIFGIPPSYRMVFCNQQW